MSVPVGPGAVPVRFDEAAAVVLIAALTDLLDELTSLVRLAGRRADDAKVDWNGCSRQWFEERDGHARSALTRSIAATHLDVEDVRRAIVWANAEQQRRNHEAELAAAVEQARLAALTGV